MIRSSKKEAASKERPSSGFSRSSSSSSVSSTTSTAVKHKIDKRGPTAIRKSEENLRKEVERLNGLLEQQQQTMKTEAVRFKQMTKTFENKMHEKDVTIESLRAKISELVTSAQTERDQSQQRVQAIQKQHSDRVQLLETSHAEEVQSLQQRLTAERDESESVRRALEANGVDAVSLYRVHLEVDSRDKENAAQVKAAMKRTDTARVQLKELESSVDAQIIRMRELAKELS